MLVQDIMKQKQEKRAYMRTYYILFLFIYDFVYVYVCLNYALI